MRIDIQFSDKNYDQINKMGGSFRTYNTEF